jgi:hypothetical protein
MERRARASLASVGVRVPEAWSGADVARAFLLLRPSRCGCRRARPIATEAFRRGDNAERVALLRALALFPRAGALRTELGDRGVPFQPCSTCSRRSPARTRFRQRVSRAAFQPARDQGTVHAAALGACSIGTTRRNPELARIAATMQPSGARRRSARKILR